MVLDSIGEVVYDWDIVSDRLNWGPNLLKVLGGASPERLSSGRAYGDLLAPDSATSRYNAIVQSGASDTGAGVSYRARYGLALPAAGGRARIASLPCKPEADHAWHGHGQVTPRCPVCVAGLDELRRAQFCALWDDSCAQ